MESLLPKKILFFLQELSYLSSVLHRKKNKPAEEVINLLNEAVDAHFTSLKVRYEIILLNILCHSFKALSENKLLEKVYSYSKIPSFYKYIHKIRLAFCRLKNTVITF